MTHAPLTMSAKSWLYLLVLSIFWAGSFIANKIALTHYDTMTIVAFRVTGGTLALMPFLLIMKERLPRGKIIWVWLVMTGIFNNITPFLLIVWGQQYIDAGLASVINAITPVMTVVIAHFLTDDEKITSQKIIGVSLGFAGIVILFNPQEIDMGGMAFLGQLALLASSLAYALSVIFLRKIFALGVSPVQGAFGQLAASSVIMLPAALIVDGFYRLPMPPFDVVLALLTLTVLCSAVAYILYFSLTREAGATNASLVTVTIPPFAILMGVVLFGETIDTAEITGMVIITIGLLVTNGLIFRKKSLPPKTG